MCIGLEPIGYFHGQRPRKSIPGKLAKSTHNYAFLDEQKHEHICVACWPRHAEEDLNNQMGRLLYGTPSQPMPPTHLPATSGLRNKLAMVVMP